MHKIPLSERPRERLLSSGVEALSLTELLAIVLGSGTRGKSVLDVAEELLVRFRGLETLLEASVPELMEIKGLGRAKAIQLKAVFGIALRCRHEKQEAQHQISSVQAACARASVRLGQEKQEKMLVLLRDVRGCLFHEELIAVGTLSELLVHPREVFYPAVRHKAHSFLLAHNHPSGDLTPSSADLALTQELVRCSRIMGIALDDHIIVGKGKHLSLRERAPTAFLWHSG